MIWLMVTLGVALFLPSLAQAQDELCAGRYSTEAWGADMDGVDKRFEDFQLEDAEMALKEIRKLVPCLGSVVLPSQLGRYARQWATLAFFKQDEVTAGRWGLLQMYTAPNLPWPDDVGEDHPLREMISYAEESPIGGPDDQVIVFPKRGAIFMNGWVLTTTKVPSDLPHLVQLTDKDGEISIGYWQDGASFREDTLGPMDSPQVAYPKWFTPEPGMKDDDAVAQIEPRVDVPDPEPAVPEPAEPEPAVEPVAKPEKIPKEPREGGLKTVNLIAGGGAAVLAGTLYAVGGLSRSGLGKASSTDELAAARSRVNILAMSAGVVGAGAVGLGVTAFVSTSGGHVGLNLRF
mgnify:CR=1 FL=1